MFSAKVFLCHLLNHRNYTNVKAALRGHSNGKCKLCINHDEFSDHLFRSGNFLVGCWMALTRVLSDLASQLSLVFASSFLDLLDDCLHTSPTHTIRLFVLFETSWYIGKQRNGDTYQGTLDLSYPSYHLPKLCTS